MEEVKDNPWSEICWYMPESREQYRLSGKLYIIKSDEKDEELKKVRCTLFRAYTASLHDVNWVNFRAQLHMLSKV